MPDDPRTPVAVERRLRWLVSELTRAQQELADARVEQVEMERRHRVARTRAVLSDRAPKVSRGGATTAERDAWVDQQVEAERYDLDVAAARTANCQDFLRVLRDQVEIARSLGASVRLAYENAGMTGG